VGTQLQPIEKDSPMHNLTDLVDHLNTPRPDWQQHAECRGMDPTLFFVERGDSVAPARVVCAECPVRIACLAAGMDEVHGMWGGLTGRERQAVRRKIGYRPQIPAACGTVAGFHAHRRNGTDICDECRGEYNDSRRVARLRQSLTVVPNGQPTSFYVRAS
jgi:WhiB family redox-sensing transcriptional regulator